MKPFQLVIAAGILASSFAAESDEPRALLILYLDSIADSHLEQRRNAISQISTRAAAEHRQTAFREKVLSLIGGLPSHSGPVAVKQFGTLTGDGFRVEKLAYESLPNFWVTANLYL